jgi:hypothetical protein
VTVRRHLPLRASTRRFACASAVSFFAACSDGVPQAAAPAPVGRNACTTFAVIESDYQSTNVALVSSSAELLADSLISSSAQAPGLSAALSGDVVLPNEAPPSGDLVLLIRAPGGVITWMNAGSTQVRAQLNVGAGFSANPHDYLEIDTQKAYVTRFGHNPNPGKRAFDSGSDVLIVDPKSAQITGTIDLRPYAGQVLARPERMVRVGSTVFVLLARLNASYTESADGMVLAIDAQSNTVTANQTLVGARNCTGIASSPDGKRLAVTCSGVYPSRLAADPKADRARQREQSALLVLSSADLSETMRVVAAATGDTEGPYATAVAFASNDILLATTAGELAIGLPDRVLRVSLTGGPVQLAHKASTAFTLGDLRCESSCGSRCMFTDASSSGLWIFEQPLGAATLQLRRGKVLVPRGLGGFGK